MKQDLYLWDVQSVLSHHACFPWRRSEGLNGPLRIQLPLPVTAPLRGRLPVWEEEVGSSVSDDEEPPVSLITCLSWTTRNGNRKEMNQRTNKISKPTPKRSSHLNRQTSHSHTVWPAVKASTASWAILIPSFNSAVSRARIDVSRAMSNAGSLLWIKYDTSHPTKKAARICMKQSGPYEKGECLRLNFMRAHPTLSWFKNMNVHIRIPI